MRVSQSHLYVYVMYVYKFGQCMSTYVYVASINAVCFMRDWNDLELKTMDPDLSSAVVRVIGRGPPSKATQVFVWTE